MPPSPTGDDLVLAERERRRVAAERADRAAAVGGAVRLRAVLDDDEVVLGGQGDERVHVDRPAAQVDRDDGAGAGVRTGCDGLGGEVAAVAVDVGDDRGGAHRDDRARGGDEGAAGTTTSSPAPTPNARSASSSASVPLASAIACARPGDSAYSASKRAALRRRSSS